MPLTQTQDEFKVQAIDFVHINPSIMEGERFYSSILGPDAAVPIVRYAPTFLVLPSISGSFKIPAVLTCNPGVIDASPQALLYYQWQADGVDIPGATGNTLLTYLALDAIEITCEVDAVNLLGVVTGESNGITTERVEPIRVEEHHLGMISGMSQPAQQNMNILRHFPITGMPTINHLTGFDLKSNIITGLSVTDHLTSFDLKIGAITGLSIDNAVTAHESDMYTIKFPEPIALNFWDLYPDMGTSKIKGYYGFNRRISTYAGPLVRIRDSVGDAEQDVGFDIVTNKLDPFTVTGVAHIVTWYDQTSFSSEDLTQLTPVLQPILDPVGSPNGSPCIDFNGGNYVLHGSDFSDASPNALHIARPTWLLSASGDSGSGFRYAAHIPQFRNSSSNPYYRMGMLWQPDEGIETRWNGAIKNWGNAADSGLTGKAILMADLKHSSGHLVTYVNSTQVNTIISSSGNFSAPNNTALTLGANPVNSEGFNGKIMELCIGDFDITDVPSRENLYNQMNDASFV